MENAWNGDLFLNSGENVRMGYFARFGIVRHPFQNTSDVVKTLNHEVLVVSVLEFEKIEVGYG